VGVRKALLPLAAALAAAACAHTLPPVKTDEDLRARLEAAVGALHGTAGVFVRGVDGGVAAGAREDELFPSASLIKIPIVAAILDRVQSGKLDYNAPQVLKSTSTYSDEDAGALLNAGPKLPLARLGHMSLSMSDNTAALWLQDIIGGGEEVNAWLAKRGFEKTRVNARVPGREQDRTLYGWGQTTPREMVELLARARRGELNGPEADAELLRRMGASYYDGEGLSQVPAGARASAKQGGVDSARGEVMLVETSSGPYVFCILTKNLQDQRWSRDNEAFELMRLTSRLAWSRYGDPALKPNPPADRFWKKY